MYDIRFYQTDKPYGCFSNFAAYPIIIDGKEWPTTEHYFQAQKFKGTRHEEEIRGVSTPMQAARMGRQRDLPLRPDWEAAKDDIMRDAVRAKVYQHARIMSILLSTGDCNLVEHTTNDAYWADNGDGSGKNMLGVILMEVRNSLPEYDGQFFLPQWIAYPGVHPYDMFWRMGTGEDYIMRYAAWWTRLSTEAREEYRRYFPAPEEWKENRA